MTTEDEMVEWYHSLDWAWVWESSGSWWWTGRPGVLQSMVSKRVRHNWVTELNWYTVKSQRQFSFLILLYFLNVSDIVIHTVLICFLSFQLFLDLNSLYQLFLHYLVFRCCGVSKSLSLDPFLSSVLKTKSYPPLASNTIQYSNCLLSSSGFSLDFEST